MPEKIDTPKKKSSKGGLLDRLKSYFQTDEEFADLDYNLSEENKKILRKFKDLD